MSEHEDKQPADVLQDAVYTTMDTRLRILESVNGSELRFRALLTEDGDPRVQLHRA